ncbi:MAG TPA: hypothetical protein IGS53_26315 [Leptolyngbyaceae cyanobacterium M33_DOE_097]|nr:hypothetical protein [Leptolyngbyaceae cyanobacterium M33_DOE_097]
MLEKNSIGLADLIAKVKNELIYVDLEQEKEAPVFWVNSVELELQVTVKREGKGGIKVYVVEAGAGISRDDVQKIKVSMTPLLTREEIRKLYQEKFPEKVREVFGKSLDMMKGNTDNLDAGLPQDE